MQKNTKKLISIVVPFFNEGEGVDVFAGAIAPILVKLTDYQFELVCVDDGSKDDTLFRLLNLAKRDRRYNIIELSRNFGKEAALTAGLEAAAGDAVIPMDADLQDPPELIATLLSVWSTQDVDVVLARRVDRSTDTPLKRVTADLFYRLHNKVADIEIPRNVGDFRLMDRCVIEALKALPERQRFMKGIFAWLGFRMQTVDYERAPRAVGESKFPGWRLWNFAIEGFTSFSTAPLRVWTYVGIAGAALTSIYALIILLKTLITGVDVPGYASLLLAILFFGSLQLISVGLLGEYIGRIYVETKNRPVYIIRRRFCLDTLGAHDEP
jgi:polyisoprenyl-phosphate glycosyltransferase